MQQYHLVLPCQKLSIPLWTHQSHSKDFHADRNETESQDNCVNKDAGSTTGRTIIIKTRGGEYHTKEPT